MKPKGHRQGSSSLCRRPAPLVHLSLASALLLLVAARGHAAEAHLGCPARTVPGGQFTAELLIDVGAPPHGAFSVTVSYDPSFGTLASAAGGDTAQFGAAPSTDSGTFTSGSTIIAAFQNQSL